MDSSRLGPIITLTTDFGLADHYVGTVKGVLLSRCPDARLVDISHGIPPFSIYSGAYTIDQAAPYFPPGAIHLVVVDPGVGTERKPLLVESGRQYFIAPDNGVLSMVVARDKAHKVREIANRRLWSIRPRRHFMAAIYLRPSPPRSRVAWQLPRISGRCFRRCSCFQTSSRNRLVPASGGGNCFPSTALETQSPTSSQPPSRGSPLQPLRSPSRITKYRDSARPSEPRLPGLCFAYFGSSGYIEVAANRQSAAELLGAVAGNSITLRF